MNFLSSISNGIQSINNTNRFFSYFQQISEKDPIILNNIKLREECNRNIDKYILNRFLILFIIPFLIIIIGIIIKNSYLIVYPFFIIILSMPYLWWKNTITKTQKIMSLRQTPDPITENKCNWIINY